MPELALISEIEIITDGAVVVAGPPPTSCGSWRRRWATGAASRSWGAGMAWRQTYCTVGDGSCSKGRVAVSEDDDISNNRVVRQLEDRIRDLERQLGRTTLEVEIPREALDKLRSKTDLTRAVTAERRHPVKVVTATLGVAGPT
jgi:transposase